MSRRQAKVWGQTETLFESDHYSKHLLDLVPGTYCSLHYHEERANRFHVISGHVRVLRLFGWHEKWKGLDQDMTLVVPSLVVHLFMVVSTARMVEEYWPDRGGVVRDDDIVRLCPGGKVSEVTNFRRLINSLREAYAVPE